ncbi:cobalt-precorrin 5A hydrolase [Crassaminicella thermophila]|uniref:Cobalt-precorrin 5A hydrolase n=1 Tax=Crassaminicella thermophila TaxID=2599308 RepID=A0A5C0SDI0_CRATE|nr:cobalt-precorrin 5A hydrolase [Crassaminicella thermophila]QEK11816.1 cobalt-precorrin 5A hydrolase [Crassaminicella thermophila]
MDKAIITLTKGGTELGMKLLEHIDKAVLYTNPKFYIKEKHVKKIDGKIVEFIGKIFNKYKCLIFIMATGIVVRSIAPYIKDKKIDPAVIVLDEEGKNVISLLSGHIGGANEYTNKIASILNANPVITTASDVKNTLAVDTLAMELNCEIEDFQDATKVTAHIVNGEKVGIISDICIGRVLPENMVEIDFKNKPHEEFKGFIYITDKRILSPVESDCVVLRPKNIVIGIGCRRKKPVDKIIEAIEDSLISLNISKKSIKHIATVDVKKNEEGIIQAAKLLGVPLVIVDREKIKEVEDQFKGSEFVKKRIGVCAVSEPVAFLSSESGQMIQKKKVYDGITIAVFREGEKKNGNCCNRN